MSKRRAGASIVAIVGLAALATAGPRASHAGECGEAETNPPPPAGHYKGTFKLVYTLQFPGVPATIKPTVTWSGDLDFDLGRADVSDPPPPPPPPRPPLRNPLRPKAKPGEAPSTPTPSDRAGPGQFGSNEEQVAAYWENEATRIERNEALVERLMAELAAKAPPSGLYVPKGAKPRIQGQATGRLEMKAGGALGGLQTQAGGQSTKPNRYVLSAEEDDAVRGFTKIQVKGPRGEAGFAGSARVTGTGGGGAGGVTTGAGDTTPVLLANLDVLRTSCDSLRGTIDTAPIQAMFAARLTVVSSEWSASLDEKDEAFEKQVDALDAEPVPEEMDWGTIDRFATAWGAIRESRKPLSDYERCVLKKLERKLVRIQLAALRTLTKHFPKAKDGATVAVMRAAMERMAPVVRALAMYGAGECPEVAAAEAASSKELQELLTSILERKHKLEELLPFLGVDALGKLGDVAEPFRMNVEAWIADGVAAGPK